MCEENNSYIVVVIRPCQPIAGVANWAFNPSCVTEDTRDCSACFSKEEAAVRPKECNGVSAFLCCPVLSGAGLSVCLSVCVVYEQMFHSSLPLCREIGRQRR